MKAAHLNPSHVQHHLKEVIAPDVELVSLTPLGDTVTAVEETPTGKTRALKTFGYGQPVLVEYRRGGAAHKAVLRTRKPDPFGHEYRADRAAGMLLDYDTFNELPCHVRALDVGALTPAGQLVSLAHATEFYLLTEYVPGQLYAEDLQRLRDSGALTALDVDRAQTLARYLVNIHSTKKEDAVLYRRRIRDLVGSGEGIMGLTDSYPADFLPADPVWLEEVEKACVQWRWRLKAKTHRLSQVHGDFHPFNVLFSTGTTFRLLDRSRGAWGEPGDDVSCMTINYLFFSVQRSGRLDGAFARLWDAFWDVYLQGAHDEEILETVPPFFAWRALVVASPVWYNVKDSVRHAIFRFAERVLAEPRFDPARVNDYLR